MVQLWRYTRVNSCSTVLPDSGDGLCCWAMPGFELTLPLVRLPLSPLSHSNSLFKHSLWNAYCVPGSVPRSNSQEELEPVKTGMLLRIERVWSLSCLHYSPLREAWACDHSRLLVLPIAIWRLTWHAQGNELLKDQWKIRTLALLKVFFFFYLKGFKQCGAREWGLKTISSICWYQIAFLHLTLWKSFVHWKLPRFWNLPPSRHLILLHFSESKRTFTVGFFFFPLTLAGFSMLYLPVAPLSVW